MKYAMRFAVVVFSVAMMVSAAAAQEKAKPDSDEQLIRGHWVCVEHSSNGRVMRNPGDWHAVFTDKEVKISESLGGEANPYRLDPSSDPKHFDLGLPWTTIGPRGVSVGLHGLYRLEGDTLTLAYARSSRGNRPTDFESAEGVLTYRFRRGEKTHTAPLPPLTAEEAAALKGLSKDVKEMSGLLEAKKYREFCERSFAPDLRKEMGPKGLEDVVENLKERSPSHAKLYHALMDQRPTFDATQTQATFDIGAIHFNGLPGLPMLRLIQVEDKVANNER